MSTQSESNHSPFEPTRWTLVTLAQGDSPEAKAALSELCEFYYEPVFRFIRRERSDDETARTLTQEFFVQILQGRKLAAQKDKGRFRSYLLGAVKHFLADSRKKSNRQKRGGDAIELSLNDDEETISDFTELSSLQVSDTWFDRQWALNIMSRGLDRLRAQMEEGGKGAHFEDLKYWLTGQGNCSQVELAKKLGYCETAIKVVIHRTRKKFGEAIRSEILQTLDQPEDLGSELKYLTEVLSKEQ